MKILVPSAPSASTPASALVTSIGPSSHRRLTTVADGPITGLNSLGLSTCHLDQAIPTSSSSIVSKASSSVATTRAKLLPRELSKLWYNRALC